MTATEDLIGAKALSAVCFPLEKWSIWWGETPDRQTGRQASRQTDREVLGVICHLNSVKHYLLTQSRGHHTIDHLEERGVERGSARRSSLKGLERAIVSQTNTGTVSKTTLGKLLRDGMERIWVYPSAIVNRLELNWTELNCHWTVIIPDICHFITAERSLAFGGTSLFVRNRLFPAGGREQQ